MSGSFFPFPPPPPPPANTGAPVYGQQQQNNSYGNNQGNRGGRGRGRGQGNSFRGGRGGPSNQVQNPPYGSAPTYNNAQQSYNNYGGYTPGQQNSAPYQQSPQPGYNYGAPQPPQQFYQQSPTPVTHSYPPRRTSNDANGQAAFNHGYHAPTNPPYRNQAPNSQFQYPAPPPPPPQQQQPAMMGPPIHWTPGSSAGQRPPYGQPNGFKPHQNHNNGNNNNRGGKRPFNTAFGRSGPKPQAPPAIPSFTDALGLPSKPPTPSASRPKKKKRKHNQLGLTPRTEDHESSEEEDVDEEAKYAGAADAAVLQFEYRGKTSTLSSKDDIEAWIAERRKKWPTEAKREQAKKEAAERKKKFEEEKARRKEEGRKRREEFEARKKQKEEEIRQANAAKKQQKKEAKALDAVTKAELMAEKLRRKAEKQRLKAEKAEALLQAARAKAAAQNGTSTTTADPNNGPAATTTEPLIDPEQKIKDLDALLATLSDNGSISISSSSEDEDATSSSGSSSSDADADSDAGPEQQTSKRNGPQRVPPPPRTDGKAGGKDKSNDGKKGICRAFAENNGQCPRGTKCPYLHERNMGSTTDATGKGRKGIYQLLVEKEQAEAEERVLKAIVYLGQQGLLDAPKTETDIAEAGSEAAPSTAPIMPEATTTNGNGTVEDGLAAVLASANANACTDGVDAVAAMEST